MWVCFWVWIDIQNRRRRVRPRASVFGTRKKGTETKRKYPSTMNRRIAWTTCDGTDASFEMDPWDRARTPKNTHLPRARIGLDDGWKPHRRTNERTNEEFHWNGLPTPMRNQRFTRCTTRRDARARHPCPVVWVDPKNLIRCRPCVCASSSSSSSPPTSIDPFDRSLQSDVFRFVSTRRGRRSGVVRTSCVHRATRKGGSVGSSALQKPSRARERIGRAIFVTVYPYVLVWVRVFGFW